MSTLPFRISTLVFIQNKEDQFLLLKRNKAPNLGFWSPIGGKLEMATGESPFECAIRETHEEVGMQIVNQDLHLFAMVSEKSYEGNGHWLLFLFKCLQRLDTLPKNCNEGEFSFFSRDNINTLPLPETDRQGLWPIYDQYNSRFVALKADCDPNKHLQITVEGAC